MPENNPNPNPTDHGAFSLAYVQQLRDEAASWRTRLRTAEDENKTLQTKLTEATTALTTAQGQSQQFLEGVATQLGLDPKDIKAENITAKLTEILAQSDEPIKKAREALIKASFMASAVKHGMRKEALEDAYKVADFSNVGVDLDTMSVFPTDEKGAQLTKDDKPVSGLEDLVAGLIKEKPWFVGKTTSVGGPSNPAPRDDEDDDKGLGAVLGKQRQESMKKNRENQDHYFK